MHRSASDSVGLIFTRPHRSTLLITTPTTTPSLVKTSLKYTLSCFFFRSLFYLAEVIFSSKSRNESLELGPVYMEVGDPR